MLQAEGFWRVYNHLLRPHQLREGGAGEEFQLFMEGVKPTWEDPANAKGGKLVVRLPPQLTSQYWEALVSQPASQPVSRSHCPSL